MPVPGWDAEALRALADDVGCDYVEVETPSTIVTLLAISFVVCILAVIFLTILHRWTFSSPRAKSEGEEGQQHAEAAVERKRSNRAKTMEVMPKGSDPKQVQAWARAFLKNGSPVNKNGEWRDLWETSMEDIGMFGGPGLALYFQLLVHLGLCFSYMFVFSIPLSVFSSLGDFAPQGSGAFPQISIANLGTESTAGVAQENRLVVINCEGMPVSSLTKYFGWLDFLGTVLYASCTAYLLLRKVPTTVRDLERDSLQASDYTVEVGNLPETIEKQDLYEERLKLFLKDRLQDCRKTHRQLYIGGGRNLPEAKVCSVVLVRDRNRELGKQKQRGELELQKEIADFKQDAAKKAKVEEQLATLEEELSHMDRVHELKVLRAFVTLNCSEDTVALLHMYRFARFRLSRTCQSAKLKFEGAAISVKRAPAPSNIFWENQDAPWKLRTKRRLLVLALCVAIVLLCLLLMWAITKSAQDYVQQLESKETGHSSCATAAEEEVAADQPSAVTTCEGFAVKQQGPAEWWLVDDVGERVQDKAEIDCFCSSKGVDAVLQSAPLSEVCWDTVHAYGLRLAVTIVAALLVVVINVGMATFLMKVAEWQLPLSISELNGAQMMKVFIAQTLNTAVVVYAVHYENINDFQRGWYAIVGVAVCTTMSTNTVVNAACYLLFWLLAAVTRRCTSLEGKHQAEVEQLYTNPPWDMASRYAYLLMTVWVTLIYSSGMPVLNLLAFLYCLSSFWADKAVLLWGSPRPPQFDATMPRRTARWLIYAGGAKCLAAVAMYGQPCVFPSNPLGGALGQLSAETLSRARNETLGNTEFITEEQLRGTANTFFDRLGRDATWMFSVMLIFMLSVCFLSMGLRLVGSTVGHAFRLVREALFPRAHQVLPEELAAKDWAFAAKAIDESHPPSSYRMEDHPEFKRVAKYMEQWAKRAERP